MTFGESTGHKKVVRISQLPQRVWRLPRVLAIVSSPPSTLLLSQFAGHLHKASANLTSQTSEICLMRVRMSALQMATAESTKLRGEVDPIAFNDLGTPPESS